VKITLKIDDELYGTLKTEAARQGLSLARFVEEALRSYIAREYGTHDYQAEIEERDRLMNSLLLATAHFRIGPRPTREEMHER